LAFAAGAAILGGSIAAYVSDPLKQYIDETITQEISNYGNYKTLLIFGMVIGSIIMLLGFLGCCGALMENQCLLTLFITLLSIIFVFQLVIGILVLVYKNKVQDELDHVFDLLETAAQCTPNEQKTECQTQSLPTFKHADACKTYSDLNKADICCGNGGVAYAACIDTEYNFQCAVNTNGKGCKTEVWSALSKIAVTAGIVALVFLLLELAAITFGFCLCCAMRDGKGLYASV